MVCNKQTSPSYWILKNFEEKKNEGEKWLDMASNPRVEKN